MFLGDAGFPEGTRSRTGGMQPFLAGVSRYFDDEITILPVGLTGTEHMFAIGEERLGSASITMGVGAPFSAGSIRSASGGHRRGFVDRLGAAVAAQLPLQYRGSYA